MPPVQGQPYVAPQNNDDLLRAIKELKSDITTEMDKRFEQQQSTLEERFKPVEDIQQTLEQARQNQQQLVERQQQQQQTQWQPKSWDELMKRSSDMAYERIDHELKEQRQAEDRARQLTAKEEADLEADIDRQLNALEKSGYLPPVGNPNDYNDPGVATRRELLGAASHMGTPELDKVADTLAQMHKSNMIFDPQTKTYKDATGTVAPLPGKFAPVGNSSSHAPSGWSGPSSAEIHSMSSDELIQLAQMRGYGPVPATSYNDTGF